MKRVALFLLGACALIIVRSAERLIAPFYGAGPFLDSTTLAVAFLALAAGWAWAAARPRQAPPVVPVVAAGIWTVLLPWARTPVLGLLEKAGLAAATATAIVLFIGIPIALLAAAIGALTAPEPAAAAGSRSTRLLWPALLGAAVAAPLVTWALIPNLGVTRTLLVAGAVVGIAGWLGSGTKSSRTAAAAAAVGVALAALSFVRLPAHPGVKGLVAAHDGAAADYVVIDREDGRFLLVGGGIQTLISNDTGDPLIRSAAAFHIVNLYVPAPESMLVIGLRGGAAARRFAREGWRVRAVESDPAEVAVASRAMHFSADEVPVDVADPRVWCRTATARYPVVLLDAFERSAFPFHLVTREFFQLLRARLTADGILALAVPSTGWDDPLITALAATLRTAFRHVVAMPTSEPPDTPGSILLVASDRDLSLPDEMLPQPTEFLMNPEEHWGVVQMNHAWFSRFEPATAGARVLTDDRNPVDGWSDRILRATRGELHDSFGSAGGSW